jgi:hypothetical protein
MTKRFVVAASMSTPEPGVKIVGSHFDVYHWFVHA